MRSQEVRPLGLVMALAAVLLACQTQPPVEAESKPKRKSFEDSGWQPSAPPPAVASGEGAGATGGAQPSGQAASDAWQRAREAGTDAERQQAANEALRATRELADAPSPSGQ